MASQRKPSQESSLPYSMIIKASHGDKVAIGEILLRYDRYISTLATIRVQLEDGTIVTYADPAIKSRLQAKLCAKILQFDSTI